jgi:hypothetical protein
MKFWRSSMLPPLKIRIDQLSYKEEQEFPTKQTVLIYKKVYNSNHFYRVIKIGQSVKRMVCADSLMEKKHL